MFLQCPILENHVLMMVPADQPTLSATLKGCVSVTVDMFRKEQAVPLVDVSENFGYLIWPDKCTVQYYNLFLSSIISFENSGDPNQLASYEITRLDSLESC